MFGARKRFLLRLKFSMPREGFFHGDGWGYGFTLIKRTSSHDRWICCSVNWKCVFHILFLCMLRPGDLLILLEDVKFYSMSKRLLIQAVEKAIQSIWKELVH